MVTDRIPALFRYPGGKQRLLPALSGPLNLLLDDQKEYHDVCVGGGSTLLWVAKTHPKIKLFANDKNDDIACFWQTVASCPRMLCQRLEVKPTVKLFYEIKEQKPEQGDVVDRAFRALFLNRCSFSGMGNRPIGGDEQKSDWKVGCRYNPKRLKLEIMRAHELLKKRFLATSCPAAEYLQHLRTRRPDSPAYIDPPYYQKGPALYEMHMSPAEHAELSKELRGLKNWVLSYDDCPEIRKLYDWASVSEIPARYSVNGAKDKWEDKTELVISPPLRM